MKGVINLLPDISTGLMVPLLEMINHSLIKPQSYCIVYLGHLKQKRKHEDLGDFDHPLDKGFFSFKSSFLMNAIKSDHGLNLLIYKLAQDLLKEYSSIFLLDFQE